jgi:hypothetical protein
MLEAGQSLRKIATAGDRPVRVCVGHFSPQRNLLEHLSEARPPEI